VTNVTDAVYVALLFGPKGLFVRTRTARLRGLAATFTAVVGCAVLSVLSGAPVAHAADGREMLANAVGATKGSYLVYNFGPGHPHRCSMPAVTGMR